ncbi:MAG: hypothetical protein EPN21_06295 [Methylococcaceae bacterium]|nr:MAG: hypothetical protein EPN21_06295 [Methylococcaceae bacterium]
MDRKQQDVPRLTKEGPALCLACRHEWVAVAPVGTDWLECPGCALSKGRFRGPTYPEHDQIFICECGNDLFVLSRQHGMLCPNCGLWQRPYD